MAPQPSTQTPPMITLRKATIVIALLATLFTFIVVPLGYPIMALGFFPIIYSLALGTLHLRREKPLPLAHAALADVFGGLAYLTALMPVWVGRLRVDQLFYQRFWDWNQEKASFLLLVVYASSVFVVNMMIHAYLALCHLPAVIRILRTKPKCTQCPHCRAEQARRSPVMSGAALKGGRSASYSLLGDVEVEVAGQGDEEETPRASCENAEGMTV